MTSAQVWLDFLAANAGKITAVVALALTVAGLIRAQIKLWRAEAAGKAVTAAVTQSGSEAAVRGIMDAAPPILKATVKGWLKPPAK